MCSEESCFLSAAKHPSHHQGAVDLQTKSISADPPRGLHSNGHHLLSEAAFKITTEIYYSHLVVMDTDRGMFPPASSLIGTQDSSLFQHGAQELERSKQVGLNAVRWFPSGFDCSQPRKLIIVEQVVCFCRINRITKAHPSLTLMQIKQVLMKFLTAQKGKKIQIQRSAEKPAGRCFSANI